MRILVTGAAGQLGNELHNVLEQKMPGVTMYTDIKDLDLTDSEAVKKFIIDNEISHVVNCAAYTAVDKAEQEPALCAKINTDAVKNIAEVAADYGVKVIHVSTDYVFDGTAHAPYKESDKVNPISTYGTTKRKGEMVLLSMSPDAVIIRTAWLYSPYGNNFVKTMMRLGSERSELGVVCDQIGTPTYALDLAEAIYTILTARQWVPGIYHFSDEGVCSWYDFTKAIHRIAGIKSCNVKPIATDDYPTLAARPPYSVLDKTRIKKTYGITIPHWEESLVDCINRLQNN
ncbi:MAG: dTDP-4-dehydrorhamnose reductase [Muribaculaceae bacterium]|jgi:dTDP-4-dehydrorhamnose reductase|nr:dTDP-4-dehydrorhamnose reductase [Muribaculaceae bacterium]